MSILKIARMGHPVLRQVARPVDPEDITSPQIQQLIEDMLATVCLLYTSDAADDP